MKPPRSFSGTHLLSQLRIPVAGTLVAAAVVTAVAALNPDIRVSVGSPTTPFSRNKQNEPALAVDANHPGFLVAGANDLIDMEACNAGDDRTCPFTPGVGTSGVYFSFNFGGTWVQPTYTGLTARGCTGVIGNSDPACTPHVGSIGTLPWYSENGLTSDGDPALAFGPKPDANGHFSWTNGSRLYYATLASNLSADRNGTAFKGFEAIAVSRTDHVGAAALGGAAGKNAWMQPVLVSKQNGALFSDKEQIWADNAASSPFFGHVYIAFSAFRGSNAVPVIVATSTDGGSTWTQKQVTTATSNGSHGYKTGCTIRTDSHGVVYLFVTQFAAGTPGIGTHVMIKSFNGGQSWTQPVNISLMNDGCFNTDAIFNECVEDGIAGARSDLSASPSVDIANGAPTGADATNEIVDTWVDGRFGLNHEVVLLRYSRNGGGTWSTPAVVSTAGDRGFYSAAGISPDGKDLYLVYNAFTTPFRHNTTSLRSLLGVVKHADIGAGGAPTNWSTLHRSAAGDPRGSSSNDLKAEFLGDYVYAVATRTYGAVVWNDTRNAADCPAIDAWRQAVQNGATVLPPAPQQQCPATFGNSDIFGGSYADPTTP
jgi:hypothetical protein